MTRAATRPRPDDSKYPLPDIGGKSLVDIVWATVVAAGSEVAGVGLTATAAWMLLRAAERPGVAALTVAIVAVRTFAILRGTLRYAERLTGHQVVLRYLSRLREQVFAALLPHRTNHYASGDLLARVVSDVDMLQDGVLRCLLPAMVAVLVALLAISAAVMLHPVAGLVLTGGLLTAGVVLPLLAYRYGMRSARRMAPTRATLAQRIVELSLGARELQVYGGEARAKAEAYAVARRAAGQERASARVGSVLAAMGAVIQGLTCLGVYLETTGLSTPVIAALTLGTLATFEVVLPLTGAALRWVEVRTSIRRIRTIVTECPPHPPVSHRTPRRKRSALRSTPDRLRPAPPGPVTMRLDRLRVHYPGRAKPALSGVDLELRPGMRIAVTGPSGSGKSTLLHTMLGLLEPSGGQITLNGHALDAYAPEQLSRVISGALADAHVFHTTVRENLLLARPGATEAELRAACDAAGFDCPPDLVTGTDGAALSGGQRQRLLLARAVLAATPIMLLDEPVEGLDPIQAHKVLTGVLNAAEGRTVVVATHQVPPGFHFNTIVTLGR